MQNQVKGQVFNAQKKIEQGVPPDTNADVNRSITILLTPLKGVDGQDRTLTPTLTAVKQYVSEVLQNQVKANRSKKVCQRGFAKSGQRSSFQCVPK